MADLKSVANKVVEAEQEAESWWKSAKDDMKRAVVAIVACLVGLILGVMLAWSVKSNGYSAMQIDQKIEAASRSVAFKQVSNAMEIADLKARVSALEQKSVTTGSVSKKKHR